MLQVPETRANLAASGRQARSLTLATCVSSTKWRTLLWVPEIDYHNYVCPLRSCESDNFTAEVLFNALGIVSLWFAQRLQTPPIDTASGPLLLSILYPIAIRLC